MPLALQVRKYMALEIKPINGQEAGILVSSLSANVCNYSPLLLKLDFWQFTYTAPDFKFNAIKGKHS